MPHRTRVDAPGARVVELFAGVGGFRLGLEAHGFQTVWANQWEPATRGQQAFECYDGHFGPSDAHVCADIGRVMDEVEAGQRELPYHDLLVGGFPQRFKHIIATADGRFRRLTPRELERLNGFPDDWTAGMPDGRRAFMMGNALVVGVIERVARELKRDLRWGWSPIAVPIESGASFAS